LDFDPPTKGFFRFRFQTSMLDFVKHDRERAERHTDRDYTGDLIYATAMGQTKNVLFWNG